MRSNGGNGRFHLFHKSAPDTVCSGITNHPLSRINVDRAPPENPSGEENPGNNRPAKGPAEVSNPLVRLPNGLGSGPEPRVTMMPQRQEHDRCKAYTGEHKSSRKIAAPIEDEVPEEFQGMVGVMRRHGRTIAPSRLPLESAKV